MATEPVALDGNFNSEALEINDCSEDDNGCNEVHDVREAISPESLAQRTTLVIPSEQKMEQRDNSALKLWATSGVDSGGREGFPDDGFADVGGNEERDAGSKTVALLQELIEKNDNESSDNQLDHEKKTDACAEVLWLTV